MTTSTAALAMVLILAGQTDRPAAAAPAVIFVCEHGAAKSLIAAAYFNKLAAERGMKERTTGSWPTFARCSMRFNAGCRDLGWCG